MSTSTATEVNGANGSENAPSGADRVSAAVAELMSVSAEGGRSWLASRDSGRAPLSHTSMKAWLARSLFVLLAATTVMAAGLAGAGLLSLGEMATLLAPIATLCAAVLGFYFGDRENH